MSSVKDKFMNSFKETHQGIVVQKYKLKVVAADDVGSSSSQDGKGAVDASGDKGDNLQDGVIEDLGEDGAEVQEEPPRRMNFQDQVDYTVQHALINQSGVLVNTLTNMIKSVIDDTIDEHQTTGPVYLPGVVFPNYKSLVTSNQQNTSNAPQVQPTAAASTLAPVAPSTAQKQTINPRLLSREQPQHAVQQTPPREQAVQPIQQQTVQPIQQQTVQQMPTGLRTPNNRQTHQNVTQVIPEHMVHTVQPDQSVAAQIIPEHLVRNIQPNFQNYQGGNLNYQYQLLTLKIL
uniref:Uncharacterized protein n=2 Tax=Oryza sativa subsp. japonica TaxID=39947 RepID=Q7G457_ORYSJ|nr:hypothetical protein [Oryza sativa Japonica Group]AAP52724.1 hypothetical protein LOC_Os10g13790 [Oryza sativa Japonica Group]